MMDNSISFDTMIIYMVVLSIIAGYYSMTIVNTKNNTFNLNKIYQAILMGIIMALIMYTMDSPKNHYITLIILFIIGLSIVLAIRNQYGINDVQFLKGMIEHHQMAIEMSEKLLKKTTDPEMIKLCNNIIKSQNSEIKWMKQKLKS